MERKLATVQRILELKPIENADQIEVATILGWHCIVRKGTFNVGDLCVFFEVDSLLPVLPVFEFMSKFGTRTVIYNGVEYTGYRLKTIKLRKQISQGLALPLSDFNLTPREEGTDLSEELGVVKYEKVLPVYLTGQVEGYIPRFFPKTDLIRIQTCPRVLERHQGRAFCVQEKLDGMSISIYLHEGKFGVCSRNLELKEIEEDSRWQVVRKLDIENKLRSFASEHFTGGICIQGEMVGPKIQDNRLKLNEPTIYFFDIFNIDSQRYCNPSYMRSNFDYLGLPHIPVVTTIGKLNHSIDDLVTMSIGNSLVNKNVAREGLAFKSTEETMDHDLGRLVFKVINPEYLLKNDE